MTPNPAARHQAQPSGLTVLLRATRAPFWPVSVIPVLIGSTLPIWLRPAGFVWHTGLFVLTLLAVLLIHIASNLANEYHDHESAADGKSAHRGGLSGGSGLIQTGALPPRVFLTAAVVCYAVAACIGIALEAVLPGNIVLVLGAIGALGGYFYTAPPLRLAYRGLGEITVALLFGVFPVVGAYFVQARTISWQAVLASLPITFAVVLVLWVNEIADAESDAAAGKLTMVTRLGTRLAGRVVTVKLAVFVFASLFVAVFTGSLVPLTLLSVLAFGLARTIVVDCWTHHAHPAKLAEAQRAALKLHLTLGIVIALSALVAIGN